MSCLPNYVNPLFFFFSITLEGLLQCAIAAPSLIDLYQHSGASLCLSWALKQDNFQQNWMDMWGEIGCLVLNFAEHDADLSN